METARLSEDEAAPIEETPIKNSDEDFVAFVIVDVERRRQIEHDFYASLDPDKGELA